MGLLGGCITDNADEDIDTDIDSPPIINMYTVEVEVTGTSEKADIYYSFKGIDFDLGDTWLPWTSGEFRGFDGDWFYVSAQNTDEHGTVIAKVYVDGIVVDAGYSYDEYGIASASVLL